MSHSIPCFLPWTLFHSCSGPGFPDPKGCPSQSLWRIIPRVSMGQADTQLCPCEGEGRQCPGVLAWLQPRCGPHRDSLRSASCRWPSLLSTAFPVLAWGFLFGHSTSYFIFLTLYSCPLSCFPCPWCLYFLKTFPSLSF